MNNLHTDLLVRDFVRVLFLPNNFFLLIANTNMKQGFLPCEAGHKMP